MLHSLLHSLRSILKVTSGLRSLQASFIHDSLWQLVVQDHLGLDHSLLEELRLIESSWESFDDIVLRGSRDEGIGQQLHCQLEGH